MTPTPTLAAALPALALGALLMAAPAAHALTHTMYPGATCTSDGPEVRELSGAVYNNNGTSSLGFQTFTCPIPRQVSTGASVTVALNARINQSSADYYCVLRAVSMSGDILNWNEYTLPKITFLSNNTGAFTMNMSISAGIGTWFPVLRCRVPNKASNTTAAIVSIMVSE